MGFPASSGNLTGLAATAGNLTVRQVVCHPSMGTDELTGVLFSDGFLANEPHPHLSRLRAEAPVAFDAAHGVWVLSRYAEVQAASRDPATFCSGKGILLSE